MGGVIYNTKYMIMILHILLLINIIEKESKRKKKKRKEKKTTERLLVVKLENVYLNSQKPDLHYFCR